MALISFEMAARRQRSYVVNVVNWIATDFSLDCATKVHLFPWQSLSNVQPTLTPKLHDPQKMLKFTLP